MIAGWLESVKNDERELRDYLLEEVQADSSKTAARSASRTWTRRKSTAIWMNAGTSPSRVFWRAKKTSDLMGNLRTKLYNRIYKNLVPVCCWLELVDRSDIAEERPGAGGIPQEKRYLAGAD